MKLFHKFFVMGIALVAGMLTASAVQNPLTVNSSINTSGYYAPQHLDAQGNLLVNVGAASAPVPVSEAGTSTTLAVSGVPVVIKATPGTIVSLNVISASGVGAIYDASTTASAVAATQIAAIPATVGATTYNFPFSSGLVINPASSVISVNYR